MSVLLQTLSFIAEHLQAVHFKLFESVIHCLYDKNPSNSLLALVILNFYHLHSLAQQSF